ncbi:MAG: undecaprenyl/decaprenyl-phosphate alpha-N-acetylglucosaminyl 1-phosphate transferase [Planctomycetes bacterium]|nr:undecaprenyl/decaprenyl-phosphate alpha-N-acetylglucosaminyl 1-phosphate transferase [Planctomycetota bacterium]
MIVVCLALVLIGLAVSLPVTMAARAAGVRLKALDTPAIAGQIKAPTRKIPNTGGIGIFVGFSLPVAVALAAVWLAPGAVTSAAPMVAPYLNGAREQTPLALALLGCLAVLHVLGLIDDRRPLGPFIKLAIMSIPAFVIVPFGIGSAGDTRLFTFLDHHVGGAWLSIGLTVLWFLIVTNAMNFMDNMDGLSAGVAAIAGGFFLAAAAMHQQWFVASCLALLVGALLGFLVFNFPPATIFMGDGGSLIIGFLLAFLTTRTTYFTTPDGGAWYAVLMPLIVLAVPLYDFASVTIIRMSKGRSPFVGDLNHLSHRLVRRGLPKRAAIAVIYGFTAVTGFSGLILGQLTPVGALLVGAQILVLLLVVALFEFASPGGVYDFPPKEGKGGA